MDFYFFGVFILSVFGLFLVAMVCSEYHTERKKYKRGYRNLETVRGLAREVIFYIVVWLVGPWFWPVALPALVLWGIYLGAKALLQDAFGKGPDETKETL